MFFQILRTWAADQKDLTGTTDQFIALAESISGMELSSLFDEWLFTSSKPASCSAPRVRAPTGAIRLRVGMPSPTA